ncbi:hypothetical protein YC2023_059916 [Brassica napus]
MLGRRDHDRDLQAQAEPLGGGSFHGVSWRDRGLYTHDRESNDLVNHIGGVFRYFIVDVVDPGSTPDGYYELVFRNKWVSKPPQVLSERMNTPQVVSELRLIDSWSPRLEEERHMKKLPSETEETRKVKEIFGLQEKKKNCWALFAAAEQVYGGRIHESVESVEMISSYEIMFSLEFSKGARICYCSQGVCDSHKVCVTICIGVSDFFMFCKFSEGFHGVLGLNLHGISVAGGVLIYVGISARQREGCCRGLKKIDSCGHMRGNKWVYKVSQLQRQGAHSDCYKGNSQDEEFGVYGLLRLDKD